MSYHRKSENSNRIERRHASQPKTQLRRNRKEIEISEESEVLGIPVSKKTTKVKLPSQTTRFESEGGKSFDVRVHDIGASYGQAVRKEVEFSIDEDKKKIPKAVGRI